jgi:beta-glucosidase-like glycosyl hydrolase
MLSRMTLEEKVSQLMSDSPAIERLGIPAYNWWNECLHGVARAGRATVFPEPIGLAATWDPRSSTRWRPPSPTRPGRSFTSSSAGGNAPSSKA